jgi:hypothetical protein
LTYDFSNKVTLQAEPVEDGHTRYVLIMAESPGLVTIDGLVDFIIGQEADDTDSLLAVLVITPDGESEAVNIEKHEGTWVVTQSHADGGVIEEIQYDPRNSDNVLHHQVFVKTFESDAVPVFMVGVGNL